MDFQAESTVRILYPDDRMVSVETVLGWARDAWVNTGGRDAGDDEPKTLQEAIFILEDEGLVTFATTSRRSHV